MNILLLTSEFAPVNGGIGAYAREIASAVTELGADMTLLVPDYGRDNAKDDAALAFKTLRFRGGRIRCVNAPARTVR